MLLSAMFIFGARNFLPDALWNEKKGKQKSEPDFYSQLMVPISGKYVVDLKMVQFSHSR